MTETTEQTALDQQTIDALTPPCVFKDRQTILGVVVVTKCEAPATHIVTLACGVRHLGCTSHARRMFAGAAVACPHGPCETTGAEKL